MIITTKLFDDEEKEEEEGTLQKWVMERREIGADYHC